jgi:hypothetical protein
MEMIISHRTQNPNVSVSIDLVKVLSNNSESFSCKFIYAMHAEFSADEFFTFKVVNKILYKVNNL